MSLAILQGPTKYKCIIKEQLLIFRKMDITFIVAWNVEGAFVKPKGITRNS